MKTCILMGGGASVKEGIDLGLWEQIKDKEVWSINFAFMTMPFLPKRELWIDFSFFRNNIDRLQLLYLQGVPCYARKHNKYAYITEINQLDITRDPKEIDKKIFSGRMGLSGIFALSLAVKEQYEVIYLLGYDFGSITNDKNTHYYQDKLNVMSSGFGKPELYKENNNIKKEIEDFMLFIKPNIKIINVSPKSNIPYFEKIDYTTFFERIANEV